MIQLSKAREKKEKEREEALARTNRKESLTKKGAITEKEGSDAKKRHEPAAVKKARTDNIDTSSKRKNTAEKVQAVTESSEEVEQQEKETRMPKKKKKIEKKGGRKIPVPCDDHGCQHMGITDLKDLPKKYLKSYVKEGNWLENKPCKDCAAKPENEEGRVMDVATIIQSKGEPMDDMARYCNFGSVAHSMKDEDAFKERFTCDMILCKDCYRKRYNMYEMEEQSKDTRRSRRRGNTS